MLGDVYSTDGQRTGFCLGACTQGKSWAFNIKTGQSTVSITPVLPIPKFSAISAISAGLKTINIIRSTFFLRNYSLKKNISMTDNDITYQIRGAIYDVYSKLGPGLLESVYEEAMVYELQKRGLSVERQLEVPIHYDGQILKTTLRLDLLVQKRIVVELKSVKELQEVFFKQTRTYLRLLDLKVGILVNFNTDNILKDSIYRVVNGAD